MKKDDLGDRMKSYEYQCTKDVLIPRLPVIARLDGCNFSKFTKGLKRPYDERLSNLMIETTKYLARENNCNIAYTQSDEITLVWYNDDVNYQFKFGGKLFKLIGDLSTQASLFFNKKLEEYLPEKKDKLPRFDCRIWNVPTLVEACNVLIWREMDATKNSISMAAQTVYSSKQLMGINGKDKQEMLFKKGINWNDYPTFFKRGSYVQRIKTFRKFNEKELSKLPLKHLARKNPELEIERSSFEVIDLPILTKVKNRIDVVIYGKPYIL